ncbi:MAG: Era-like GTP-binding protein [Candidatus Woesearchaeota archaeon]
MVFRWFKNLFSLFKKKKEIKLGLYGPPNSGKTTLANKICKDWLGEELGSVSHIAHETREIKIKEKVVIKRGKKTLTFDIIDTPGIATRIDYEDFLKEGLSEEESKERAREATKGVIEAIKWLDNVEAVIVVLDSTQDPYTQVNITIIGNLAARKIPVIIAANKIDLPKADLDRITNAFPQYPVIGISAKEGTNVDLLYDKLFEILK